MWGGDGDREGGGGGGEGGEVVAEDGLNIVISVTSAQDTSTTQPCTQGVKSGGDDNPGGGDCGAGTVGPCSCRRGSLVSTADSGGSTVLLGHTDDDIGDTGDMAGESGGSEAGEGGSSMASSAGWGLVSVSTETRPSQCLNSAFSSTKEAFLI